MYVLQIVVRHSVSRVRLFLALSRWIAAALPFLQHILINRWHRGKGCLLWIEGLSSFPTAISRMPMACVPTVRTICVIGFE